MLQRRFSNTPQTKEQRAVGTGDKILLYTDDEVGTSPIDLGEALHVKTREDGQVLYLDATANFTVANLNKLWNNEGAHLVFQNSTVTIGKARKNTNFVNQYLIEANEVADYTVFVSKWLMETYLSQGLNEKNNTVILGGANSNIFNPSGFKPWDRKSKLKIVTHHWGAHWNKGFEIYEKLDQMIGDSNYKDKIEFCYIGNLPNKFKFRNSQTIKPLSGEALSNEIKKNHLYLTASINEPSGNHHIEAAQCGLPILYINSGGTPEYCEGYGIEFNNSNFEEKLNEFILNYDSILSNLKNYPYNSEIMCEKYFNLFLEIFENRENIVENRSGFDRIGYFDQSIFLLSRKINKYLK